VEISYKCQKIRKPLTDDKEILNSFCLFLGHLIKDAYKIIWMGKEPEMVKIKGTSRDMVQIIKKWNRSVFQF
jgi:hypothetical protein